MDEGCSVEDTVLRERERFMLEAEFDELSEKLFSKIEDAVDALDLDVESNRAGNVLTLETEAGDQIVINRHTPTFEVWVASRAGGSRFFFEGGKWLSSKDKETTIWESLSQALSYVLGKPVTLENLVA